VLDTLHAATVRCAWAQRFTALTRLLLALAFIPSGLVKALGLPFTSLGPDTAVGAFFGALYASGFYYRFIGLAQLLAAVLLLFPRTATVGALIYLPIVVNIVVITLSIGFQGTWVITCLMLLANVYLLCWEYDTLKRLWPRRPTVGALPAFGRYEYLAEMLAWGGIGTVGYGVGASRHLGGLTGVTAMGLLIAWSAGTAFGLILAWHLRHAFHGGPA
jgi:hypothetical protein